MTTTYTPQPGTTAYRILAWLEAEGKTSERNSSQIANAMGIETNGVPTLLAPALAAHLVFRRQKDRTHPRAPFWYSLTDHGVRQREFTPNPVGWMNVKKDADEVPVFCEVSGRTKSPRMADADSGVGVSAPMTTPSPTVTNLPGRLESSETAPPAAPPPAEQPRAVDQQFAAAIDKAMQPQHVVAATFTLRCAGTLDIRADDLLLRLNDEQVGRLRRLLGGAA